MGLMLTTNAEMVAAVLSGGEGSDSDSLMRAIAATRSLAMVVDDTLRALVKQARASGRTWAEIGELLSVTRQAAFQRFGSVEPATPEAGTAPRRTPGARKQALAVLRAFLARHWEAMRADFDERMRSACSVELLTSVRIGLETELGELQNLGAPLITTRSGYTVVDVPISFQRGDRTGRVVLDADGRVAGFFVLPGNPIAAD